MIQLVFGEPLPGCFAWATDQQTSSFLVRIPFWIVSWFNNFAMFESIWLIITLCLVHPLAVRSDDSSFFNGPKVLVDWVAQLLGGGEPDDHQSPARTFLLVLAFASLSIAQINTRAHINHSYAALVLLIPLVIRNRGLLVAWIGSIVIHLAGHVLEFGLGRAEPTAQGYDWLISAQQAFLGVTRNLNSEPLMALLGLIQFVLAIDIMRRMFINPDDPQPVRQGMNYD